MFTATQCRMARAALRWDILELAAKAGVGRATVSRFEAEQLTPRPATVAVIQRAFEEAGVTFRGEGCVCAPAESAEG
jgi:transcriptional regulator with XRE-family HTH domain